MIVRKNTSPISTTTTNTSSISSTSYASYASSHTSYGSRCDADEKKGVMSSDGSMDQSRPLSVSIPTTVGAYGPPYPRRPNLREILANTSPPPWTLAAFMAYLSSNHCLETLEFTMDAGRYKKHYAKMMSRATDGGDPPAKDREYVAALWQRLVEAYIQPNGSREVNLPSQVRDPIVSLKATSHPPPPEALDPAVAKIYELMEESVLVPFLNSVYLQTAHPVPSSWPYAGNASDESLNNSANRDEHSQYARRPRPSPPLNTAVPPHGYSYSPASSATSTSSSMASASHYFRKSTTPMSTTSSAPPPRSRFSVKLGSPTSSTSSPRTKPSMDALAASDHYSKLHSNTTSATNTSNSGSAPMMTDDSGNSTGSPTHDSPMTPPMSPPGSGDSPKRDSGMWKKLGRLSGMKVGRKKSLSGLKEEGGAPRTV
ncbi:unnamed protein product [Zymoseptoria tritici ST99CH_3D1]|nr:unnamed protein product [Zymoseptoria tritici ST99CH_3D1]